MSKGALLATTTLALGLATLLLAQEPTRPLTQEELLKTLDGLSKGDPLTKAPLSSQDKSTGTTSKAPSTSTDPALPVPATPKPKKPKTEPGEPPPPPGETVITSEEGAFDQKTHQAVFTKKVFVKNPDFTVSCEKLTAFMKHDDAKAGGKERANSPNNRPPATPAPGATPAPPGPGAATPKASPPRLTVPTVDAGGAKIDAPKDKTDATQGAAGGLDKAIAEIDVIITQDKVDEEGNVTHNVGRGKKAVYESATGDVTLTGKPEVQQGINTCVSLSEDTIIILNRDGHMTTIGPTRNTIRESGNATPDPKKPKPATPAANGR